MPTQDPSALLERLCRERGEAPWLEFKVNNCDPEMIGQWVSACSNAAILADKPRGYLVFGIENLTRKKVGTSVRLSDVKKGGENLENYLSRMVEPRLMLELIDFEYKDKAFSIIVTEPTYDRPVRFAGVEYIRIGENTKRLGEHPAHERAVWFATNRRKFEDATALSHQSPDRIRDLLRIDTYYKLTGRELPKDLDEQIREFCARGFLVDDMEGGFDITNLGAILFAYKLGDFPSIAAKSVRVIRYTGKDKTKSDGEDEGVRGYAIGFGAMIKYITARLPSEESYEDGIRRQSTIIPEVAIREIIANALIHQDFTIVGSGPIIDVYSDRVEVTNPGSSTVDVSRIIDERGSRNEKFAATMRSLGICEERGGGIDKALIEIEKKNLPPPLFLSSSNSMRVVLFGRRPFSDLSKADKIRACFQHCVIRWISHDYMSNTTLRDRFSLQPEDYQAASQIISATKAKKLIKPAEPAQGNRSAKYVPHWA